VTSKAGVRAGGGMSGGELIVHFDVENWPFREMRAEEIDIAGSAGARF